MKAPMPKDGQQQLNVDISLAKDLFCVACKHPYFKKSLKLKHMSALLSPSGEAMLIPVEVLICEKCDKEFNPDESFKQLNEEPVKRDTEISGSIVDIK